MHKLFAYITLLFVASGCNYFGTTGKQEKEQPILRVYDSYLYPSNLVGLHVKGLHEADSIELVKKFIKEWTRYQVIAGVAKQQENIDLEEIELKAQELKYQLITHEYEKSIIQSKLDTLVSEEEITDYYNQHKYDFQLRQNIVRAQFIKIHKSSPKIYAFKSAFISGDASKKEFILEYCQKNADQYTLNDSTWFNFSELVFGSPFQKINDPITFLKKPSTTSKYDGDYYYYLKVIEARLKNDISPLQFNKKQISNIICNQRKIALIKSEEEKLIKQALDEQSIQYYQ